MAQNTPNDPLVHEGLIRPFCCCALHALAQGMMHILINRGYTRYGVDTLTRYVR